MENLNITSESLNFITCNFKKGTAIGGFTNPIVCDYVLFHEDGTATFKSGMFTDNEIRKDFETHEDCVLFLKTLDFTEPTPIDILNWK